jgi:OTT_1508-like deaminase
MKNNTKIRIQGVHAKKVQIPELSSLTATQLRLRARGHQFNPCSEAQLQSMINRWPKYRLHSEIQLIVFYEENPDLKLCNNYIGCDKLSCYLCHRFIMQHGQFEVNGCHSSLYSLWTVPDIVSFQNAQRASHFQHALKELCGDLERKMTALRDSRTQRQKFATNNESFANLSRLSLALTVSTVERLRPEQSAHEFIPSHGEILKKSLSTPPHDLTQISELSLIEDTGRIHKENDILTVNSELSLTAQSSTVAANAVASRRIERPQSRPPEMDACTETGNYRSSQTGSAPIPANSVSKYPSGYGSMSQNGKPRLKELSQSRPRRHRNRKRHQNIIIIIIIIIVLELGKKHLLLDPQSTTPLISIPALESGTTGYEGPIKATGSGGKPRINLDINTKPEPHRRKEASRGFFVGYGTSVAS